MRHRQNILACLVILTLTVPWTDRTCAQESVLEPRDPDEGVRVVLDRRVSLDLRDATLLESLFAVRDITGLNLVVGNEVTGTVNAAYSNTPVRQILDSLLIPRGYSFRIVSGSLAILPLESIGDRLPNFQTAVIRLQANTPDDVLPSVESILSPEGRIHPIATSNSLMIMDYPDRINEAREQIEALEVAAQAYQDEQAAGAAGETVDGQIPTEQAGTFVRVFQPQYVPATNLSESLQPLLTENGQIAALDQEDKLIVTDTNEALERVAQALTQLDLPRPQVRIWALIYDAGLEDLKACGINFGGGVYGANIDAASGNPNHSAIMNAVTSTVGAPTNGVLTLSTINRLGNVTSVIQALETADDSRLLADPNVVVMNHESAEIEIVTEVPYQQLTQGIDGGTIGTTEFREAGVTMTVTPHIAQDNTISMVINPRFSLLTGFTDGDNAPIIDRRETLTTVRVENLQTLVLGGLRQRTRTAEHSAIPGLSKVPYLGHLFRFKRNSARESELIVFLTPEIVTPNYPGTAREACLAETLHFEIEQTPTGTVPFGFDVLTAEERAYQRDLNRIRKQQCNSPNCKDAPLGLIGGFGR